MAEKKKKSAEEKKKLEEELDDQRGQHEKEVADLKEKLRQQKTSKDAASAQQVKDIEAELNRDWQTKCDRLVSAANELHKKELAEVKEELDKQQQLYKSQEGKLASTKTSREAREKKILSLEEQVEDLGVWKDKYEKLRSQASTMKERYEQRITELEETSQRTLQAGKRVAEERDAAVKRVGEVQEKARDAMRALREEAAKKGASGGGGDSSGEVKKIMNNVFRDLKSKFDAKKSYSGGDIQAQVLATIKEVTLQMIQSQKAPREEVMKEMSHMSGDSGNPHYAAELDRTSDSAGKSALEDSIAAMLEPSTDSTGKEPDKASKDLESRIAGMIEPTVSPSSKAAGEGTRKTESPIKPATSHVTGDKGNPHYAKELEKSQGMSSVEARIESLIVPEGLVDNKDGAPGKTGVETPIEASQSNVSGDKGNPHYAKELEATSKLEAQIAGLIVTGEGKPSKTGDDSAKTDDGHVKARAAHSTGDKGNPHYAKQLEAGSKLEAQIEGLIVPNTGEEKPEKPLTLKDKGGAGKTEDVIKASASQSTGDKGNPHYAKQLEDSNPCKLEASIAGLLVSETGSPKLDEGKSRSEESAIQPISSHTTGDKGNIHYAEELKKGDEKKDLESRIESLIQPESGSSSKQTTKLESQIESMIVPQTEGGNTDKGRGNASKMETAITPDSAHVTGDKGNIHYAKELEKSQDSKSSKSSLESQIESLIVTDAPSDKDDGGKKKSSSEGKGASDLESKLEGLFDSGFESSIKEEKSHITGDKGNQHYKKELDKSGGKDGGSETANSAEAARKAKAALALFGDDEDEDGFSFLQKPADKVTKKATPDKKTNKQSKTEDDDTTRPRPPPLFGDSDDDDGELDWLS